MISGSGVKGKSSDFYFRIDTASPQNFMFYINSYPDEEKYCEIPAKNITIIEDYSYFLMNQLILFHIHLYQHSQLQNLHISLEILKEYAEKDSHYKYIQYNIGNRYSHPVFFHKFISDFLSSDCNSYISSQNHYNSSSP